MSQASNFIVREKIYYFQNVSFLMYINNSLNIIENIKYADLLKYSTCTHGERNTWLGLYTLFCAIYISIDALLYLLIITYFIVIMFLLQSYIFKLLI